MDFPGDYWAPISSTNPLERVKEEIKRRSDASAFVGKTIHWIVF